MGDAKATQLEITVLGEARGTKSPETANVREQPSVPQLRSCKWWVQVAIYSIFVLSGQSTATILGRLYYAKGGKSKWMATLVQVAAFPILLPLLLFAPAPKNCSTEANNHATSPSRLTFSAIYVLAGLFLAAVCMLFSIGLLYLPVSTFSLICASQLGFNAFFSFFLNSLKLTPSIINSVVLLTISSILLVFQTDTANSSESSRDKYVIGFLCTVGGAAGYALFLSLTQLFFRKILKGQTFRRVLDMIIYESLVATSAIVVGLFASREWKSLKREMEEFELGKSSYVLTLVWAASTWQISSIGLMGLIFKVSSLFANVISTVGLPIVPVLAVTFFHDKMTGVKVVALLLAIWGFVSYIHQHYLDDLKPKYDGENVHVASEISLVERG